MNKEKTIVKHISANPAYLHVAHAAAPHSRACASLFGCAEQDPCLLLGRAA
jgi:hypothetical protein